MQHKITERLDMTDYEILNDSFPRLGIQVHGTWGTRECRLLLLHLINDSRGGERRGFPPEVAAAITRLLLAHDEKFPHFDDSQDIIVPFSGNHRAVKDIEGHTGPNVVLQWAGYFIGGVLVLGVFKEAYKAGLFNMFL